MASPIEIPIASETKAFAMGVENGIIKPLDDAEAALKNLGKGGDKASDDLDDFGRAGKNAGNDIEDALNDAQRASDKTRRELDDLGDAITKAGRKGADIDDGFRKGAEGASEATAEFKDEAIGNLSETVSSFRGDAEDLAQIAQDTLGGVIANLGPAGLIAGTAGAVGIGLMMGAAEEGEEKTEAFRAKVGELADEFIEAGSTGELSIEQIADRLRSLVSETEEGVSSLADLREDSEGAVSGYKKIAQAMAGNVDGIDEIIAKEKEHLETIDSRAARKSETLRGEIGQQRRIVAGLEEQRDAVEAAAESEAAWHAAGGPALEARASQLEALQGELDDSIGAWSEFHDAEKGATDPEGYIAAMQQRMDATSNFNSNVQQLAKETGLSFEEQQAILEQGVDFGPMLQSIIDNGLSEEFAAQIQAAVGGGQEILDGTPLGTTVTADADTTGAQAALDATAEDRGTTVEAAADTKAAGQDLDAVANKRRTATIRARAETGTASTTLSNLARDRSMTITVTLDKAEAERQLTEFQNRYRETTVNIKTRGGKEVP